jgi:hypothetical protein
MPGTPTARFSVANLDQWGRLIKSWATELDYISQDYAQQPPRNKWVNTTWPAESHVKPPACKTTPANFGNPATPWFLPPMDPVEVPQKSLDDPPRPCTPVAVQGVAITAPDFRKLVGDAGVTITNMPEQYRHVVIVQGTEHVMIVRLPPKHTLQSSEDDLLLSGDPYGFPQFYSNVFWGPPHAPKDQADIMKLHANRIGEYTLNVCN